MQDNEYTHDCLQHIRMLRYGSSVDLIQLQHSAETAVCLELKYETLQLDQKVTDRLNHDKALSIHF